jgi:hypothetical protein
MNIDYILEEIRVQNKRSIHNRINRSIEPISDWLYIDGKNYFDDIFDLKNLDSEWKTISQKIGIPHTPLPKNNVRNKKQKSYRRWYSKDMVDKVNRVYGDEIETFKFTYDE